MASPRPARWLVSVLAMSLPLLVWDPAPARAACSGGVDRGPCASPDAVRFLPGGPPVALTNFGLLYQAGDRWEVSCDDTYALAPAARLRRAPDGRIFAPSDQGLLFTADGCGFQQAGGALAGKIIFDVAFDAGSPQRVWALGDLPRKLWLSGDAGLTFTQLQSFPDPFTVTRLVSAPSDPQRLYIFGRSAQGGSPTGVSTDGGQTVTSFDLSLAADPKPPTPLEFLGISAVDPLTVYFVSLDGTGDEIWRTTDGGKTVRRLLKLEGMEALGGFAFGPTSGTIYVAGTSTDLIPQIGQPPARLYISRDGGTTWQTPIPSPTQGPRFTCLAASGDAIYACTPGELLGDPFMVGVSRDEGKTWSPLVKLDSLGSARACVRSQCLQTELWLCESYGKCAPGVTPRMDAAEPGPVEDAGAKDAVAEGGPVDASPAPRRKSSGCSLSSDAHGSPAAASVVMLGLLALAGAVARRYRAIKRR